ncbi:MAG: flagellar M-ring protein FliF [Desulfofustis sp.]|nr:flagellar M-ring protein FliF [Desulfofustis sp.]
MATQETTTEVTTARDTIPARPERKRLIDLVRAWPLRRKIAFSSMAVVGVSVLIVLILQARISDYQLLYANLAEADAGNVVTWLKGENIPYQLKNNGKDIWIGADKIYETRLNLAANGLPTGGDVGFEVFDKQSFALTDYVQKVNYTRALQGELARTITSLAPVEATRVHLAIPEKRLFKNQQQQPSASVIVTLVPGKQLDPSQVQGIVHLVSGSVTDLEPELVKVIDANGRVLDLDEKPDQEDILSADMLAYQQEVEHRLEMRAQDLLDTVMGVNKAMARVTASLDFAKVEQTQEVFDADDPVVRSEQINTEASGTQTTGGIPGVQSNLQGPGTIGADTTTPFQKSSRTTNYEISKTISRTVNPVGTIRTLSVSILVADREITAEDGTVTSEPLAAEELASIENMVASALGLIPERGDRINVVSMPFTEPAAGEMVAERLPAGMFYQLLPALKIGLLAFALLLCYLFLIRPIVKTMRGDLVEHYKTVEELERERLDMIKSQHEAELAEKPVPEEDYIIALRRDVMKNPVPTAFIIKNWIQEV